MGQIARITRTFDKIEYSRWEVAFEANVNGKWTLNLIKTNKPFQVFATIVKIVEYVIKNSVKDTGKGVFEIKIYVSKDDEKDKKEVEKRVSVYEKLLKRFAPSGWEVRVDHISPTYYRLVLRDPSKQRKIKRLRK